MSPGVGAASKSSTAAPCRSAPHRSTSPPPTPLRGWTSPVRSGDIRASDDRTHQARVGVSAALPFGIGVDLTAAAASGVPDPLDRSTAPGSLGPYRRVDGALRVARRVGGAQVRAALSVYNLFDRQNPWYREAVPAVVPGRPQQVSLVPVDVYDLGATPSFEIAVRW